MKSAVNPGEFLKAIPIDKVDEVKQEAWGTFTAEVSDSDNEIADYNYQKKKVQEWSDSSKALSVGDPKDASLGNVRFSHTTVPVGKVIALQMDDAAKTIGGGTYIMNVGETKAWDMVAKNILRGFSFGGRYDWRKCAECGRDLPLIQGENFCDSCGGPQKVRYGASIAELSVCDRPAVPVANILHIKADGSQSMHKVGAEMDKEAKTKRVAGEDLTSEHFAYVGDPEKTETWKFPISGFSSEEKTKRHVRNALARFNQAKGIPADKKAEVKAKIVAAAKKYGIEVSDEEDKAEVLTLGRSSLKAETQYIKESIVAKAAAAGLTLRKDLFDVANMAELLQRIAWLRYSAIQERDYEGDDSEVPEELEENLISLSETFLRMAQEETAELVSAAKKAGKVTTMSKENGTTEKTEIGISPETADTMTGHVVDMQAHHEKCAEQHKAMAAHHDEHIQIHKAIHEHFKKAAEDGGEMAEHHSMHADAHKAHMDHHTAKSAHHKAMGEMHEAMGVSCGKMAEAFADTPEKAQKVKDLQKAAREKLPTVKKGAPAPVNIDTSTMSASEVEAFEAVKKEYYASPEYKAKVRASLDAQTTAKLNIAASTKAAVAIGVDSDEGVEQNIYAVPRAGQVDKSQRSMQDVDDLKPEQIFSFLK